MSDIFENYIDNENDDVSSLEDSEYVVNNNETSSFVSSSPLYKLLLPYSRESIYATASIPVKARDYVIIPTRYGKDMALVSGNTKIPAGVRQSDVVSIERVATENDLNRAKELRQKEKDAFPVFKEKAAQHNLDMKLISTHFLFDEQKVLFFFNADNRVDFRDLVKDLVSVFKIRIELRQIGVRDESRITGGLGVCGRQYCCHCISDKLRPVSIRMAKDQNLSLNSTKISGQCGRLLCCLSYECEWYADARKKLPTEGVRIFYDGTKFRVTGVNLPTSLIKMVGEDGRIIEVNAKRFVKESDHWNII